MSDNGSFECKKIDRGVKTNFSPLFVWLVGVLFSFFPLFIDIIAYKSRNEYFNREFFIGICLRGDILCVLAVVLVMSVMESYIKLQNESRNRVEEILTIFGFLLCGFMFSVWTLFKYYYPESYNGVFPICLTAICVLLSISVSSVLQVKLMEVK